MILKMPGMHKARDTATPTGAPLRHGETGLGTMAVGSRHFRKGVALIFCFYLAMAQNGGTQTIQNSSFLMVNQPTRRLIILTHSHLFFVFDYVFCCLLFLLFVSFLMNFDPIVLCTVIFPQVELAGDILRCIRQRGLGKESPWAPTMGTSLV